MKAEEQPKLKKKKRFVCDCGPITVNALVYGDRMIDISKFTNCDDHFDLPDQLL